MAIRASIFDASDIELKIVLERSLQSGNGILDIIDEVSIRGCSTAFRRRGSHLALWYLSLSLSLSLSLLYLSLCFTDYYLLHLSVKSSPFALICSEDLSSWDLAPCTCTPALLSSFSHALFFTSYSLQVFIYFYSTYSTVFIDSLDPCEPARPKN